MHAHRSGEVPFERELDGVEHRESEHEREEESFGPGQDIGPQRAAPTGVHGHHPRNAEEDGHAPVASQHDQVTERRRLHGERGGGIVGRARVGFGEVQAHDGRDGEQAEPVEFILP